jgi:site-specific recombinase XerD
MSFAARSSSSLGATDVEMAARHPSIPLTHFAAEFLETKPAARVVVRQFDLWLKASCRPIRQLESSEIELFLQRLAKTSSSDSVRISRRAVALQYFDWLHARQLLSFDTRCAWPRSNFPLPPQAQRFLELLKPTHSLSTVRSFQTSLRQFHIWLHANGTSIVGIDRIKTEAWLQWIHARGLAACTRVHVIQQIRAYLEWLQDEQLLPVATSELLRGSDLPKLPQYLPRPVPPDLDALLQRRFKSSGCSYQLGLLLMRRTGLRIGELAKLPFNCVRTDHAGNVLLKVPLGKLNTERLVPLDPKTAKLISKLRRQGPRKRTLLLVSADGRKSSYYRYQQALKRACHGLTFAEPMTTHRLRHTYATSLLAGGMSLPSVMRLLGHTDYRMTLRYAAITDSTVFTEFDAALERSAERYPTVVAAKIVTSNPQPLTMLLDVARHVKTFAADNVRDPSVTRALVQRLRRLHTALCKFFRTSSR